MIELGYVFILATLVQAVVASGVLILLPLIFIRWVRRQSSQAERTPRLSEVLGILMYFGCIGVAFMSLEMAILPKYTLLLSHPVYSAAVVLSTILVFAGFGSLCVRRFQAIGSCFIWIPVAAIFFWVGFYAVAGDRLFEYALKWTLWNRIVLTVILLSVPSFFLGWLFPSGLRAVARKFPGMVPWAWGINGCASVIGAVLGKCLTISIGFRPVMFAACALYFLAAAIFQVSLRDRDSGGRATSF